MINPEKIIKAVNNETPVLEDNKTASVEVLPETNMSEQNSYDIQLRPEADIQSDNVAAETPVSDTVEQAADTNSLEPAKNKENYSGSKR